MRCGFTGAIATGLAKRGHVPSALIIPGHPRLERPVRIDPNVTMLPIAGKPGSTTVTRYPTYSVGSLTSPGTIELVESFTPDVLIVACFPRLIPRVIREIPHLTALNVHPSLLPAHRGPDPLFWIMRDGGSGCGVTLHELDRRFDTGAILAQRAVQYPDGVRESELEFLLAANGAELTAEIMDSLAVVRLCGEQQDARLASYESWPTSDDFTIDTQRPARNAWNFIRGVAGRGIPVRVQTDTGPVLVADALAYGDVGELPATPETDQVVLQFASGWVLAQIGLNEND